VFPAAASDQQYIHEASFADEGSFGEAEDVFATTLACVGSCGAEDEGGIGESGDGFAVSFVWGGACGAADAGASGAGANQGAAFFGVNLIGRATGIRREGTRWIRLMFLKPCGISA
jgi:hypothetical protein